MNIKWRAAHKLSTLNPQGKLTKADAGFTQMQASSNFPEANWPITPASVQKAITDLDTAIKATATGAPGSISHMHEMEKVLVSVFNLLRSYVELTANDTSDPKTIIESAGMTAYISSGSSPVSDLTLLASGNGVIEIQVPRGKGEVAFIYQYSKDGGTTWLDLNTGKLATETLSGQTAGSTVHVRFAPIGKTIGAFSQAKSVMVI